MQVQALKSEVGRSPVTRTEKLRFLVGASGLRRKHNHRQITMVKRLAVLMVFGSANQHREIKLPLETDKNSYYLLYTSPDTESNTNTRLY